MRSAREAAPSFVRGVTTSARRQSYSSVSARAARRRVFSESLRENSLGAFFSLFPDLSISPDVAKIQISYSLLAETSGFTRGYSSQMFISRVIISPGSRGAINACRD